MRIQRVFIGLSFLLLLTTSLSSFAATASLEDELKAQDKKIQKLEKEIKKNKRKLDKGGNAFDQVKLNGFFSAGVTKTDSDVPYGWELEIDDDLNFQSDSNVGVQMQFTMSERTAFTLQMISNLGSDEAMDADWAYISYKVTDTLTAKIGRIRTPYFLISEYLGVGFAYPQARPPTEIYWLPLTGVEGIDLLWKKSFGSWLYETQFNFGGGAHEEAKTSYDFETDHKGMQFAASSGAWTFRLGYSVGNMSLEPDGSVPGLAALDQAIDALDIGVTLSPHQEKADFLDFGLLFDDGQWLVMSELTKLNFHSPSIIPGDQAGYLTCGRRFDSWLPYFTYSRYSTLNDFEQRTGDALATIRSMVGDPAFNQANVAIAIGGIETFGLYKGSQQTSYSLGLRKTLTPRMALKAEITRITDFDDSFGFFSIAARADGAQLDDSVTNYTLVLDAVF